mgnify:CR=1 FL=1
MPKIMVPIEEEDTTESIIPKLTKLGTQLQMLKRSYPSVWSAMVQQYHLDSFTKEISSELFEKKLEILLMQDDELRSSN